MSMEMSVIFVLRNKQSLDSIVEAIGNFAKDGVKVKINKLVSVDYEKFGYCNSSTLAKIIYLEQDYNFYFETNVDSDMNVRLFSFMANIRDTQALIFSDPWKITKLLKEFCPKIELEIETVFWTNFLSLTFKEFIEKYDAQKFKEIENAENILVYAAPFSPFYLDQIH